MFAGIVLVVASIISLALCLVSLARLNQRLNRYELPENTHTLFWRRISLRHFAWLYVGLVIFWFAAGVIIGIGIIIN